MEFGLLRCDATPKSEVFATTAITQSVIPHWGYSVRLEAKYAIAKKIFLTLQPGIERMELDYRLDGLHFGQDFNGIGFNDSHIIYSEQSLFFCLPLIAEYQFTAGKFSPFLSIGASADFKLSSEQSAIIYYSDGTIDSACVADLFRTNNYAAIANAGINYLITKRIGFSVSASFKYFFLRSEVDLQQYHLAGILGIYYIFK